MRGTMHGRPSASIGTLAVILLLAVPMTASGATGDDIDAGSVSFAFEAEAKRGPAMLNPQRGKAGKNRTGPRS